MTYSKFRKRLELLSTPISWKGPVILNLTKIAKSFFSFLLSYEQCEACLTQLFGKTKCLINLSLQEIVVL